jgi:hypothetical protein
MHPRMKRLKRMKRTESPAAVIGFNCTQNGRAAMLELGVVDGMVMM